MYLRNEKGMAMAFALVIGLILTVSGVAIYQVSTTDNTQVAKDNDNAQAYFYAKSGVEVGVGLLKQNPDYLAPGEIANFYGSLGGGGFSSENTNTHSIDLEIERVGELYIIRSTGLVRRGDAGAGAQAAANALGFTINMEGLENGGGSGGGGGGGVGRVNGTGGFAFLNVLLRNSAEIYGEVAIWSSAAQSVYLHNSALIQGNVYVPENASANVVRLDEDAEIGPPGIIVQKNIQPSTQLPEYPAFPTGLPSRGSLTINSGNTGSISSDGSYSSFDVKNGGTLNIDLGGGERKIRVDSLNLGNDTKVILRGGGRLYLYIDSDIKIENSSDIYPENTDCSLLVYYSGSKSFTLGNSARIIGELYSKDADIDLSNSAVIDGCIVTGSDGTAVILGNSSQFGTVVYAPNGKVALNNSVTVYGVVIANELEMDNSSCLYNGNEVAVPYLLKDILTGENVIPSDWRVTGQWQRL